MFDVRCPMSEFKMIYFDNNSTTPLAPEVEAVLVKTLGDFGNPSSVHALGQVSRKLVNEARESIAQDLHVPESTILFTSGGTESLNLAMLGAFLPKPEGKHLVVSKIEHAAVLKTAEFLQNMGVEVTSLEVDGFGRISLPQLEASIKPNTVMIAVMFVNNEIGNIYPVKKIGEIARDHKIFFLCDAVQAVGRMEINLSLLPIDMIAASAHKFHGPKGVGFLYVRKGIDLTPLHLGGGQERGLRAGTENVPGIAAMAMALQLAMSRQEEDQRKISRLRDQLQAGILERIPGVTVHGDIEHRVPHTLNFRIEGISGESLLMNLDQAGIAASAGAACESGSMEPSHVLLAMGIPLEQARGGLRFSLSRYNTEAEVEEVLRVLPGLVERIKAAG